MVVNDAEIDVDSKTFPVQFSTESAMTVRAANATATRLINGRSGMAEKHFRTREEISKRREHARRLLPAEGGGRAFMDSFGSYYIPSHAVVRK